MHSDVGVGDADRTCVHCAVARAIRYVSRRADGVTFSVRSALDPCIAPVSAARLYRSIRGVLTADVGALPARPASIEVRVLGGTHPFVDLYVTTTVSDLVSTRMLSIARHREGTLEGGFPEGDMSADVWMRADGRAGLTPRPF